MEMHNSSPCRSSGESLEFASSGYTIRNYVREKLTGVYKGLWGKLHEWSFEAIRITSRGEGIAGSRPSFARRPGAAF